MSLYLTNSGASLVLATGGIPVATGLTTPLADGVHPRLLMVPDGYTHASTPTSIRAKMASDATIANGFIAHLDSVYASASTGFQALAYAFLYQISAAGNIGGLNAFGHSQADYGAKAKALILATFAASDVWYHGTSAALIAIDWVWDLFSDGEKLTLKNICDDYPEQVWNDKLSSLGAVYSSNNLMARMIFAGEDIDETWVGDFAADYESWFRADWDTESSGGITRAASFWGGTDGGYPEGGLYGNYYWGILHLCGEEAYRTANGISKATHYNSHTNLFRYHPRYVLHSILPDALPRTAAPTFNGGYQWMLWPEEKSAWPLDWTPYKALTFCEMIESMTGLYAGIDDTMCGLAAWLLANRLDGLTGLGAAGYYTNVCPFRWTLGNPATSAISPVTASEPVSKWHARGVFTSRLTWDDSIDEPWVGLTLEQWKGGGNYAGRSLPWPGNLMLNRKGPVLMHRGSMDGHGSRSYSILGSSLFFPNRLLDHTTVNRSQDNFGSKRAFASVGGNALPYGWTTDAAMDMRGTVRQSLASGDRTVDYLFVDMTRNYSSNKTNGTDAYDIARISSAIREVVYFRPASESGAVRLFVYDTYTRLNKKVRPEAHWSVMTVPSFGDGTTATDLSRGLPGTQGITYSTDATYLSWDTGTTIAFLTKVLPASNCRMITEGGANSSGEQFDGMGPDDTHPQGGSTDSREFDDAYGVYQNLPFSDHATRDDATYISYKRYLGWGSIQTVDEAETISDTSGTFNGSMLHVIEAKDTGGSRTEVTTLPGVTTCVGAIVGDAVAVFATGGISQTACAFRLETTGTFYVHLARLNPSATRTITKGANITSVVNTVGGGTTYTASSAGELLLTVVVGTAGTGDANTITVS